MTNPKRRPRPQRAREQPRHPTRTGRPQPSRDERALREQILEFTYQERFRAEFEPALRRYSGQEAVRGKTICVDEMSVPGFQEWYISEEDPLALHYNWLLRGRSQVPEASKPQRGIMTTTTWTAGVDGPSYRSLGDVLLWPWQLELRCMSKERLRAGKSLLKEILGRSIRHLGDEHADMEALLEDTEELPPPRPRRPLSKAEQAIQRRDVGRATRRLAQYPGACSWWQDSP